MKKKDLIILWYIWINLPLLLLFYKVCKVNEYS